MFSVHLPGRRRLSGTARCKPTAGRRCHISGPCRRRRPRRSTPAPRRQTISSARHRSCAKPIRTSRSTSRSGELREGVGRRNDCPSRVPSRSSRRACSDPAGTLSRFTSASAGGSVGQTFFPHVAIPVCGGRGSRSAFGSWPRRPSVYSRGAEGSAWAESSSLRSPAGFSRLGRVERKPRGSCLSRHAGRRALRQLAVRLLSAFRSLRSFGQGPRHCRFRVGWCLRNRVAVANWVCNRPRIRRAPLAAR